MAFLRHPLLSVNHQPRPGDVAWRASSQSAHGCAATSRRWDIDLSGHEHRGPLGRVAGLLSVGETNDSGLPTIARDLFVEHPPIEQGRRHSHATVDPHRPVTPDPPSRSVVTFVAAHLPQGQLVCIAAVECVACPIVASCGDWAMVHKQSGLWGGALLERGKPVGAPRRWKLPRHLAEAVAAAH